MPFNRKKRSEYLSFLLLFITGVICFVPFFIMNWNVSIFVFLFFIILALYAFSLEYQKNSERKKYISDISFEVEQVSKDAFLAMPFGILLIDKELRIHWINPYLETFLKENKLIGNSLFDISKDLATSIMQEKEFDEIELNHSYFRIFYKKEKQIIYFYEITSHKQLEKNYNHEKVVVSVIYLDNYEEISKGMDDAVRSQLNSQVTSYINEWTNENGMFAKRFSADRFLCIFNEQILKKLEEDKFSILDIIREETAKKGNQITLSIGIGSLGESLTDLNVLSQAALELALGRGGDQVVIKTSHDDVRFYGGKTNPTEKRNRVRARTTAQALSQLIGESNQVLIMGHKRLDMDSIGASIGLYKLAMGIQKEAFILLDYEDAETSVKKLVDEIRFRENLLTKFISPEKALEIINSKTLLFVVDTHRPSLVLEERLLKKTQRIVVIDHHRLSEETIESPLLAYMEPYASSTCELVTELLQYQSEDIRLEPIEATALLAGIIVDTMSFTMRTGSRTFDAASFLRTSGADTTMIQMFLKIDVESFIQKSKLIERVQFYKNEIAIAKSFENEILDQTTIAQAADELLLMDKIQASFVISKIDQETVSISARSLGKINVQLVMEALEGGGHLTNAATQLSTLTLDEAEVKLKFAIDQWLEGEL